MIKLNIRRDDWESLKPTVGGWGINDVNYAVSLKENLPKLNGKVRQKVLWVCPYYRKWSSMIYRCFCPKYQEDRPTYKGCTITEDWKYLSNFIKWVDSQPNKDWQNCEPDKDFLSIGNKHYSPETVVFVSLVVNKFITDSNKARGNLMLGVTKEMRSKINPYRANCGNPFDSKRSSYVGCHPTEIEAHLAWQAKKHEYALQLADMQEDERIASRLREMYAPDKDWTDK